MNRRLHIAVLGALATVLAASSLSSLFLDAKWLPLIAGATAAVTVGGELGAHVGRRIGASMPLRALGGLTGALFYVCAVWAHPVAPMGFLPSRRALRFLRAVWLDGSADVHDLAPRVPTHLGLTLIVSVGVAGVALAVNLLSSRPAIAGLPLLTMFVVPVALAPHGVGLVPFVLAATGYLLLLAAEGRERAERWGRHPARREPITDGYGQSGRRIGAAAVALAVVIPLVVPGLHANRLFTNGDTGIGGDGDGGVATSLSPLARIQGQLTNQGDTNYFTYTSTTGKQYTRIVADDVFDGTQFLNSGARSELRASDLHVDPRGLAPDVAREVVDVQITMSKLREHYLPVPLPLASVTGVPDRWRYDDQTDTIFSQGSDTGGLTYTTQSYRLKPTDEQLQTATSVDANDPYFRRYLTLPTGLESEFAVLSAEAHRVTQGATSDYDKAKALESYFSTTGGYTYDQNGPDGLEENALTQFIHEKRGYCVQFASSMAIMARLLGIPSRVDVGFTGGRQIAPSTYLVTSGDSHAWPELYFGGVGWMRFEPTPATGTITPNGPPPSAFVEIPRPSQQSTFIQAPGTIKDHPSIGRSSTASFPWAGVLQVLGVLAALSLLGVPAYAARWRRRRAWSRAKDDARLRAHVAWQDIVTAAENLGHRFQPGLSVRGMSAALEASTPMSKFVLHALDTVSQAEETARYAKTPPAPNESLEESARMVTDVLFAHATRFRRTRAIVLPPDTLRSWGQSVRRVLTAGSRLVDAVMAWASSLGRRRAPVAATVLADR